MTEQMPPSPTTPANLSPVAERRLAVRYSCTLKTLCQTKTARPEDFWWWGKVRDISTTGISLLIKQPFEPGTHLIIEPLTGRDDLHTLLARVIRATKQARGGWLLGCEFACPAADRHWVQALQGSIAWDCLDVT